MPAQTACPISEVDRALASYINSRDETLKIRRALSKYLITALRPVTSTTQNQHLNHECPHDISAVPTNPPGLKDSRALYLKALRAHTQAIKRHRELQSSLEDLQQRHIDENPVQPVSDYANESPQDYVALLRQRCRVAELQVIQDSLEKLINAKPYNAGKDPKGLVKETIGEQPDLPVERLEQLSATNSDQTMVFKLKQEVLDARASMDKANVIKAKAQNNTLARPSLQQQVHALQCARDEIIEWVQGELAKLEEDSVFLEDASPIKRPTNTATPVDVPSAEVCIREAYKNYSASRARLVESYESLQQFPQMSVLANNKTQDTPTVSGHSQESDKPTMPITKLLPHIPQLMRTANIERSLLQQSVYLQSQIASADQEVEEALLRLSGESHLLPAGSKDVIAWGNTALEAEAATEKHVKEHLMASQQEMGSISTIVELCSLQSKVLAS